MTTDHQKFLSDASDVAGTYAYMASPYYSDNPELRAARRQAAEEATAYLVSQGDVVFTPVAYTCRIEDEYNAKPPQGWYKFDFELLRHAKALVVLTLPGWEESKGVAAEIAFAKGAKIPVSYSEHSELMECLSKDTRKRLGIPDDEE